MVPTSLHPRNDVARMMAMRKMDEALGALDLRALHLLATVLRLRSVTRAAEELGLSQPAASRALAHLRRALGD